MTYNPSTIKGQVIIPLGLVAGGIFLGLIIEIMMLGRIKRKIAKEENKAGEIAILSRCYMISRHYQVTSSKFRIPTWHRLA